MLVHPEPQSEFERILRAPHGIHHRAAAARPSGACSSTAHTQTIRPSPGRDYYQRRHDTGNSRNEALRLLKRQLTKTIYRTLLTDANRTRQNAPT